MIEPIPFDPDGAITGEKVRILVKLENINLLVSDSKPGAAKFIVQSGYTIEAGDKLIVSDFELDVIGASRTFDWGRFGWLVTVSNDLTDDLRDLMTHQIGD